MAYTSAQKRQHIYELQTYLHAISLMDDDIPLIIPNGIYDANTVIAVKAFQRKYGLPDTGNTDAATWNRIVSVYRGSLTASPLPYAVFPSAKYTAVQGDSGQLVYVIQAMLHDVSTRYDNAPEVPVCGEFDDITASAVKRFQQWSGTWNMLVHCCEHINQMLTN